MVSLRELWFTRIDILVNNAVIGMTYGASKAAVRVFTKSLSRKYRQTGMTANLLSPGVVKTDLFLNRASTEEGAHELKKAAWIFDYWLVRFDLSENLQSK
ncbi:MAG: SDR family NAD(P)-dependent oxidoreductase [Nitrospiria bacterium]